MSWGRRVKTPWEEAHGVSLLLFLSTILLFITPFLLWPGFGSDIPLSPLDIFLLENYPLWFMVLLPFTLGMLVEIVPAQLAGYYFKKVYVPRFKRDPKNPHRLDSVVLGLISVIPLLIILLLNICFDYNPLGIILLMYLAKLKGYQGKYYWRHMAVNVVLWFSSGVTLISAVKFFFLSKSLKEDLK